MNDVVLITDRNVQNLSFRVDEAEVLRGDGAGKEEEGFWDMVSEVWVG